MAGLFRTVGFIFTGSKNFTKDGFIRQSAHFDQSVMAKRLDGKVCLVTGANQGLGLQTSEELAARGAHLYMVCRNAQRGQEAVEAVKAKTGNQNVHLKVCDVSSLESCASLAKELEGQPVHVLVNNAGVLIHERQKSADGYDINFATNTLGCFVLTLLLEKNLQQSAASKVVFVSSGGALKEPLDTKNLQNEDLSSYDGIVAYSRDKRRQIALAERFAERWKGSNVFSYSMHPGWAATEGVRTALPGFSKYYADKMRDVKMGADTIVWLCLQDDSKLENGGFYLDRQPQSKHLRWGGTQYTPQQVDQLWDKLTMMGAKALMQHAH
mmetsp:Transcript_9877/g.24673  ORF Transcript_9877/g.24673 Transcript_9877/m.24673 type:complete len:325 (-) Transcript_9877:380-1354(-)